MLGSKWHLEINRWLLYGIAFSLPFAALTPIFIALLFLNWLLEGAFKEKLMQLRKQTWLLALMGFYLLHVLGLAYTENMKAGSFDLEVKLSLFLLPLMIGSRPPNQEIRWQTWGIFLMSCLLVPFLLLIRSFTHWFGTGENAFFYQAYSIWMHPSYFALYLCLGMLIAFELYRKGKFIQNPWLLTGILLYLSLILILLSSKMGLITLILILISALTYLIISRKKYLIGALGITMSLLSIFMVYRYVPSVSNRISQMFLTMKSNSLDRSSTESSTVRLLIWHEASQLLAEQPLLGHGTGDAKDALMRRYKQSGMSGAYEKEFNAHSSYYQVAIALGYTGLIWQSLLLIGLFVRGWNISSWILSGFILLCVINFFVESMLETQAGVMFFAFFAALLHAPKQETTFE